MTTKRFGRVLAALGFLVILALPVVAPVPARATVAPQSQTTSTSPSPTPSVSPTNSVQVNAKNTVFGLLILTGCAAGGYFTAKWIRRRQRPRPPGPWFGGRR